MDQAVSWFTWASSDMMTALTASAILIGGVFALRFGLPALIGVIGRAVSRRVLVPKRKQANDNRWAETSDFVNLGLRPHPRRWHGGKRR